MSDSFYRNPLIQRVQRHASLATLFSMATSPSGNVSRQSDPWVSSFAFEDNSPASVDESRVSNDLSPLSRSAGNIQLTASTTTNEPVRTSVTHSAGSAPQRTTGTPGLQHHLAAHKVQRSTSTQTSLSGVAQPPDTTTAVSKQEDDSSWRRLQAIYRKHQQKAEIDAQSADAEEVQHSENNTSKTGGEGSLSPRSESSGQFSKVSANAGQTHSITEVAATNSNRENLGAMASSGVHSSTAQQNPPMVRPSERSMIVELPQTGSRVGNIQRTLQEERSETNRSAFQQTPIKINTPAQTGTTVETHSEISANPLALLPEAAVPSEFQDSGNIKPRSQPIVKTDSIQSVIQKQERSTAQIDSENEPKQVTSESFQSLRQGAIEGKEIAPAMTMPSSDQDESGQLYSQADNTESVQTLPETVKPTIQKSSSNTVSNVPDFKSQPEAVPATHSESDLNPTGRKNLVDSATAQAVVPTVEEQYYPTHTNPLPLQEVWSVQRKSSLEVAQSNSSFDKSSTNLPPVLAPIPDQAVQSVLQAKPTGQPTASAVELLAPRYPRPHRQQVPKADNHTSTVKSPTLSEATSASSHGSTQGMVETEIGLLPSDLWDIIGQSVPTQGNQSVTTSTLQRDSSTVDRVTSAQPTTAKSIQSQESVAPTADLAASALTPLVKTQREYPLYPITNVDDTDEGALDANISEILERGDMPSTIQHVRQAVDIRDKTPQGAKAEKQSGTFIQRQQVQQSVSSSSSNYAAQVSMNSGQGLPEEGEVNRDDETDIEDLANKIYSNLRRRLAVDWERVMRR